MSTTTISIDKIKLLPSDILNLIKEFIPKKILVFTNRENYKLYHSLIQPSIKHRSEMHDFQFGQ